MPNKLVPPPVRIHAHHMGYVAFHVPLQTAKYVLATVPHSTLSIRKLSSSFCLHVQPYSYKTYTPRVLSPTAELLQSLAHYSCTM